MDIQYITDRKGKHEAVILPIKEWKKVVQLFETKETKERKLRTPDLLKDLKEAVKEVKLIKSGKKKPKTIEQLQGRNAP